MGSNILKALQDEEAQDEGDLVFRIVERPADDSDSASDEFEEPKEHEFDYAGFKDLNIIQAKAIPVWFMKSDSVAAKKRREKAYKTFMGKMSEHGLDFPYFVLLPDSIAAPNYGSPFLFAEGFDKLSIVNPFAYVDSAIYVFRRKNQGMESVVDFNSGQLNDENLKVACKKYGANRIRV